MLNLNWPKPPARNSSPVRWLRFTMIVLSLCCSASVLAHADEAEHRQHSAHVHDVMHLSLISEGDHLRMELQGAAAGFLGFEHAPMSKDEVHAVAALKDRLETGENLFLINSEARCSLDQVTIELPGLEGDADHEHHDDNHHQTSHHEDHQEEHADVEAYYDFTCRSIDELETVEVTLFDHFPGFETVEAVYLLEHRQSAQTLRPGRSILRLR